MKRVLLLWMLLALAGWTFASQQSQGSTAAKILTAQGLWGKDFASALAALDAWNRIGQRTVAIHSGQIVGGTAFKTFEEAQRASGALARALQDVPSAYSPAFKELLQSAPRPLAQFKTAVDQLVEDDTIRVVLHDPARALLAAALTIQQVEMLIGKPEKRTTLVIQSKRDMRPAILTLNIYAGGAIIFAESDLAPKPGLVDRVILDVPVIASMLFKEAR